MGMFAMAAEVEALISGLPDALVVIDAETATYVAVNEAACRIVGRTRDEMMAHGPVALANDPSFPVEVLKRAGDAAPAQPPSFVPALVCAGR